MMEPSEENKPSGVAIPLIAYACNPSKENDSSRLTITNYKTIQLVPGNKSGGHDEDLSLDVDHVFQNSTEDEVLERSVGSTIHAVVEGVNACLFCCGSSSTNRREFIHGDTHEGLLGLEGAILQQLFALLVEKEQRLSRDDHHHRNDAQPHYDYFVRLTFIEFYEDMMTDLLFSSANDPNAKPAHLVLAESESSKGFYVKHVTRCGPLASIDKALEVLRQGREARQTSVNAHGPMSHFTSTLFKIDLAQVYNDRAQSNTVSSMYVVDMPATERLDRSPTTVRLTEGPVINKTLFACQAVILALAQKQKTTDFPPFGESHLTQLLRPILGGPCLTQCLLFVCEKDMEGTRATLTLGRNIARIENYPVLISSVIEGLLCRSQQELLYLRQELIMTKEEHRASHALEMDHGVRKVHDLEGRLIKENLEKLRLKEEKEKIVRTVAEFRLKYQQLVESKSELQKSLIETEEEKLKVSKALLDLQLENNGLIEKTEQEKYEIVTKLLNAENDILEFEMREEQTSQRGKELEESVKNMAEEKKELAMEFVALKQNYVQLNASYQTECTKNQQLGVEVLSLANQKSMSSTKVSELEAYKLRTESELVELEAKMTDLQKLSGTVQDDLATERRTSETLRSEKAHVQLELQSTVVKMETLRLELDKSSQEQAKARDDELVKLKEGLDNELSRAQSQREAAVERAKELEWKLKQSQRQVAELDTALARKTEEVLESSTLTAKLSAQLESKEEEYRTKLMQFLKHHDELIQASIPTSEAGGVGDEKKKKKKSEGGVGEEGDEKSDPENTTPSPPSEGLAPASRSEELENRRQELTQELLSTCKAKESEALVLVSDFRRKNHELIRKNRMLYEKFRQLRYALEDLTPLSSSSTSSTLPDLPDESELTSSQTSEFELEMEQENAQLREKCAHLQHEFAQHQEKHLSAAESYQGIVMELEKNAAALRQTLVKLENERDGLQLRLEAKVRQEKDTSPKTDVENSKNDETLRQMKEMQSMLMEKMQELRDTKSEDNRQNQTLRHENEQLKDKLTRSSSGRISLNQSQELEDAERRCAELMTKQVMAVKELESYKKYMKQHTLKLTSRISELEAQLAQS